MEEYFKLLFEQYKKATGTEVIDLNSRSFSSEFVEWMGNREKEGNNYLELLKYMKLYNFADEDTIEVGKGCFDSVVKNYATTIVTPYTSGLISSHNKRIIEANFKVFDSIPVLVNYDEDGFRRVKQLDPNVFFTFMTQNPYYAALLNNWETLHNSGNDAIIVGVYGNNGDRNREDTLKLLRDFRDKLEKPYKEEYAVINGSYYYAVATDRLSKVKVKEKKFGAIR